MALFSEATCWSPPLIPARIFRHGNYDCANHEHRCVLSIAQRPHQPGLSTALGCLKAGFVVVGSLPTQDGTSATVGRGSLTVLDRWGNLVLDLSRTTLLDGPWDLTIVEDGNKAHVFVCDVLTGTVTRLNLITEPGSNGVLLGGATRIASGYTHRFDPAALVIGPPVSLDAATDTLYVASTGDNAIYRVSSAKGRTTDGGTGALVYTDSVHLHCPLALVLAP